MSTAATPRRRPQRLPETISAMFPEGTRDRLYEAASAEGIASAAFMRRLVLRGLDRAERRPRTKKHGR